jgi:hypothetical protein
MNAIFKQEVRSEMDELRSMITALKQESNTGSLSAPSLPSATTPSQVTGTYQGHVNSNLQIPIVSQSSSSDPQNQMMLLFAESFSKFSSVMTNNQETLAKLSSALTDKSDSKADWPKFSGDQKKFRAWYLAVMAQISLPPWAELYNSTTNNIVSVTTNSTLNGKLYSKLLLSLEGNALKNVVSRKHLQANGLALLQELVQTYRPKNVPEIIAFKTSEFWGNTKRFPSESIDEYYNRFHELLDEIEDSDEPISTKSAIHHFIFTLGSEFETIQNDFRLDNLPAKWTTEDWPTILILCRDYYNSVKPHGLTTERDSTSASFDREAHQKKIRQWFMNPTKFSKELTREQLKYPDKCLYHLSKSHVTDDCHVRKECARLCGGGSSNQNGSSNSSGQLRHLTEEIEEEVVELDDSADCIDNDTNEEDLIYFVRVSNHYLCLVKNSLIPSHPRHPMKFPIIADSGATHHMFKERDFFDHLTPSSGSVTLGDGKTSLLIKGVGTVRCRIGDHVLILPNVRYIPTLGESIYSLFLHIQQPGHSLHSSYNDGLMIKFPTFTTKAIIGHSEIYLDAVPLSEPNIVTTTASSIPSTIPECCCHITDISSSVTMKQHESDNPANLINDL